MADVFKNLPIEALQSPANIHLAVTPSNTVDFPQVARAIYCQADGTAQVVDAEGTVLPYAMIAGQFIPVRAVRINATGTTGTFYVWY